MRQFYFRRNHIISSSYLWGIMIALMIVFVMFSLSRQGQDITPVPTTAGLDSLEQFSLAFVPNQGQTDPAVQFETRGLGGRLFFTPQEVVLRLPVEGGPDTPQGFQKPLRSNDYATLRLRFEGANPAPDISGGEPLPGIVSYFRGNDPTQWQTNLPTYAGVTYHHLYNGIDLHYDGLEGTLKGTFTLAPGVDPAQIRWRYVGTESVRLDEATGDLVITMGEMGRWGDGEIEGTLQSPIPNPSTSLRTGLQSPHLYLTEQAPVAWQTIDGQRTPVSIRYDLAADGSIGFKLGDYDTTQPLIIDPTLEYSSYLGGNDLDQAWDATVDAAGNVYIAGETNSDDFATLNPFQSENKGSRDAFVAKFSSNGTRLYTTYLGGNNLDVAYGIAVDSSGHAYVTGQASTNIGGVDPFPSTLGAYQTTVSGGFSAFVTKLNPSGNGLVYSTLLGGIGTETGLDIAFDSDGHAYVMGRTSSSSFPLKNSAQNTYGGNWDAFVTKFNPDGSDLVYSTYLGGDDWESFGADAPGGIAVDSTGHAYVTGYTQSSDFPTTVGAFDRTLDGDVVPEDPFVTKLSVDGGSLVYSTYLGGNDGVFDRGQDIAVDAAGHAYVIGTTSAEDFPTRNAIKSEINGTDAFITKLNPAGSDLVFSTFLGGNFIDYGYGLALDEETNIYVTGTTFSSDFPTQRPLQAERNGTQPDVFIAKLPADGSRLIYSTYLGGEDRDEGHAITAFGSGNEAVAYVVGEADDTFPVQDAAQATYGGGLADGFVTKINDVVFDVYLPVVIK